MKHTCPCCGYKTLDEKPTGTYEICGICFWEDDEVQYRNPDYEGGANAVSLRQARGNFMKMGACDKDSLPFARKPNNEDRRDLKWKVLQERHPVDKQTRKE